MCKIHGEELMNVLDAQFELYKKSEPLHPSLQSKLCIRVTLRTLVFQLTSCFTWNSICRTWD